MDYSVVWFFVGCLFGGFCGVLAWGEDRMRPVPPTPPVYPFQADECVEFRSGRIYCRHRNVITSYDDKRRQLWRMECRNTFVAGTFMDDIAELGVHRG